jgi:hypothetical protein
MLRPYVCVVCEKAIIAKADEVPSLISLFSRIIAQVPAGEKLPANAVSPIAWCIFSSWDPDVGDELKEYTLCTQVLYPDQTPFGETSRIKMPIEQNKRCQMQVNIRGFPVGQNGKHTARTWVEEDGKTVVGPIDCYIQLEVVRQ